MLKIGRALMAVAQCLMRVRVIDRWVMNNRTVFAYYIYSLWILAEKPPGFWKEVYRLGGESMPATVAMIDGQAGPNVQAI